MSDNMAAMREALERCRNVLLGVRDTTDSDDIRIGVVNVLEEYVEPALAEPPRNCDVGTADDQAERFIKLCRSHTIPYHGCDGSCPLLMSEKCALAWSQMPYEEGEKDERKSVRDAEYA